VSAPGASLSFFRPAPPTSAKLTSIRSTRLGRLGRLGRLTHGDQSHAGIRRAGQQRWTDLR
jgi:hypothetical protein